VIDLSFNEHRFFDQGYNRTILPARIRMQALEAISSTQWTDGFPRFADWMIMPESTLDEQYYEEMIRTRYSYGNAPAYIKNIANEIVDLPFFDNLKNCLVKPQFRSYRSIRNITPIGFGIWDGQEPLDYHNDISDTSSFFVLLYFSDWLTQESELLLGKRNESNQIETVATHNCEDSTMVVINNQSPLFFHSVAKQRDLGNYCIGIRYRII